MHQKVSEAFFSGVNRMKKTSPCHVVWQVSGRTEEGRTEIEEKEKGKGEEWSGDGQGERGTRL